MYYIILNIYTTILSTVLLLATLIQIVLLVVL